MFRLFKTVTSKQFEKNVFIGESRRRKSRPKSWVTLPKSRIVKFEDLELLNSMSEKNNPKIQRKGSLHPS